MLEGVRSRDTKEKRPKLASKEAGNVETAEVKTQISSFGVMLRGNGLCEAK